MGKAAALAAAFFDLCIDYSWLGELVRHVDLFDLVGVRVFGGLTIKTGSRE